MSCEQSNQKIATSSTYTDSNSSFNASSNSHHFLHLFTTVKKKKEKKRQKYLLQSCHQILPSSKFQLQERYQTVNFLKFGSRLFKEPSFSIRQISLIVPKICVLSHFNTYNIWNGQNSSFIFNNCHKIILHLTFPLTINGITLKLNRILHMWR